MIILQSKGGKKMEKIFTYSFKDESEQGAITFEYNDKVDEKLSVSMLNTTPMITVNQSGALALAKLFLKMALGEYKDGFHTHVSQDFDADKSEALIIGVAKGK
ncbi:hypothetical protein EB093_08880 [bacterium]|nr:hypothetical protein [bacterium]